MNGLIAVGELRVPIELVKLEFLKSLQDREVGKTREWTADKSTFVRYTVTTDILWYPIQPVLFTFRDDALALIEFSGHTDSDTGWDYSLAVAKYFRMKAEIVKHLDRESRWQESDASTMEAVWDFEHLSLSLACDAKSGGCGILLRPLGG